MISQKKYVTISVPKDIKERLEEDKSPEEDWGEYLARIYDEWRGFKGMKAFEKLEECLDEEDWDAIERSHKAFKDEFKFRIFD